MAGEWGRNDVGEAVKDLATLVAQSWAQAAESERYCRALEREQAARDAEETCKEWVTNAENARHAHRTGLCKQSGEDCRLSKLSSADVQQIRSKLNDGCSQEELSKQYGVSRDAILNIKLGRRWGSLPSKYTFEAASGAGGRKLTSCDVDGIRQQIAEGFSNQQIASGRGVKDEAIRRIRRGESWKKQEPLPEGER